MRKGQCIHLVDYAPEGLAASRTMHLEIPPTCTGDKVRGKDKSEPPTRNSETVLQYELTWTEVPEG